MTAASVRIANDALVPRFLKVLDRHQETADTFSWRLDPGPEGFPFEPGQFNMISLPGVGEVAISISGNPDHPEVLVHTIRNVGRVTGALAKIKPGAQVGVRGPFGTPWPMARAEDHDLLLVAGGIGLAPLRPVIYQALARRNLYRRIILLLGARRPEELLYPSEALAWGSLRGVEVAVTVDRAPPEWMGRVGVVTTLFDTKTLDPERTVAMLCGPEVMMRFAAQDLLRQGFLPGVLYASMERNMHCAVGSCGHCQLGPLLVCRDGPVFPWPRIAPLINVAEL